MFFPPLAAPRRRFTSPPLSHRVVIAAELKNLLEPSQLADLDIAWLAADQPTPKGDWVAIVPLLSRWVGGTELKNLPNLRIVANCAVGYNNVDLVAAEMRKVLVTNTPGVLTEATADLTWALILATARRLVEGVDLIRSGKWTGWHPEQLLGVELRGRTLGLFGAGRIGQAVGRRALPFGLRVLYTARTPKPDFERETGATRGDTTRLLAESDIVSLHVPSTPETKGIINNETRARMRRGAILINTSRGNAGSSVPRASTSTRASRRSILACSRRRALFCCRTSAAPRKRPGARWRRSRSGTCRRC